MTSLLTNLVKRVERLPKPTRATEAMQPLFECSNYGRHIMIFSKASHLAKLFDLKRYDKLAFIVFRKLFAYGFAGFLFCSPASAFYSMNNFLKDCQASLASGHSSFCLGFVAGVLESIQFMENTDVKTGKSTCIPNDIDSDLVVRTFINYANTHPEYLNGPAVVALHIALIEAYPAVILCRRP
jgi:hypothetical protein